MNLFTTDRLMNIKHGSQRVRGVRETRNTGGGEALQEILSRGTSRGQSPSGWTGPTGRSRAGQSAHITSIRGVSAGPALTLVFPKERPVATSH